MLSKTTLLNELRSFADSGYPLFEGFPETFEESADKWSNALYNYAQSMTPTILPSGLIAARQAFTATYLTMRGIYNESNWIILSNAFGAFAGVVSLNVAPYIPSYTPIGSILYPILKPVSAQGLAGASNYVCLDYISTVVDAWFKTGVSMTTTTPPTFFKWM